MFSIFEASEDDENLLQKFLLINISEDTYALKIEYIKEIIPAIEMFSIQDAPDNNITGIINLRGETVPIYDIRNFLGKNNNAFSEQQKFIILTLENKKIGIIIDAVGDIVQINENTISPIPIVNNLKFLNTTVVSDKTIVVINIAEFAKQISDTLDFQQVENIYPSSEIIKSRTQLINTDSSFLMKEDVFLNEKFIVFSLNEEIYAFNISYVKEIKKISDNMISKIPCVPDFILGIINFRGDYISVLDIKYFLGIEKTEFEGKKEIVIIETNDLKVAILTDFVLDITNLPISQLIPNNSQESFVIGELAYTKNRMINLLNVEKLFSKENFNIDNNE